MFFRLSILSSRLYELIFLVMKVAVLVHDYGFFPMLIVIAKGAFPASCGVRCVSQWIPAATSAEQKADCAGTDAMSSGAIYASIPESNIVAAVSPAASTLTPPALSICDGTRFHPADFASVSNSLSSANGSGSGNTAKAKFCPAKGFKTAINLFCCSGDRVRGSLNFTRASAASEADCCAFASLILESVRSCSNWRRRPSWRLPIMSPVMRAPAPEKTVKAIKTTVAQSQIDFQSSIGIEAILHRVFLATVLFIGLCVHTLASCRL
jgi:hypothetical protein